jgi:hypothetical protein
MALDDDGGGGDDDDDVVVWLDFTIEFGFA